MHCIHCGQPLPPGSRFCHGCGQAVAPHAPDAGRTLQTSASPPSPPAVPASPYFSPSAGIPASASRWPRLAGLIALVLVLAAVVSMGAYVTVRSLTAAGKPGAPGGGNLATVPASPHGGNEFTAVPPLPGAPGRPFTPAAGVPATGNSMVAAGSRPLEGSEMTEVPPPIMMNQRPFTPGTPPMAAAQIPIQPVFRPRINPGQPIQPVRRPAPGARIPPTIAPQAPTPPPQGIPPDVLAYLYWLSAVDGQRCDLEGQGLRILPYFLAELPTAGLGMDPTAESNASRPAELAREFSRWEGLMVNFSRRFHSLQGLQGYQARFGIRGPARVPDPCRQLHVLYSAAMTEQVGAADRIGRAMLALQLDGVVREMNTSKRIQALWVRANQEMAAICERYGTDPGHVIEATPGDVALPPLGVP